MKSIAQQTGLFCTQPLRGYYRYRDLFQILPVAAQNETFQHDHPLILELCYCPDIWPHRDQLLWHRDWWERERYNYIRAHSPKNKMGSSDEWVKAYERMTKLLRRPAITDEVSSLLTLFTNYRFFTYGSEQHWFIPSGPEMDSAPHQWGQLFYAFDTRESGTELSDPAGAKAARIPVDQYYKSVRDPMRAGEDNTVQLPENIDRLFDLYFGLDQNRKTGFYTACHLYNKALELCTTSASLSLVAAVMAIEALVNCVEDDGPVCEECRTRESIDTCDLCGLPQHHATSRFKQFIMEFCSEELKKFANDLYKTRSKLAHGGLLRDDLHDSGFYAGHKDEEQMFRRESLVVIRIAILNWLIRPKSHTLAEVEDHAG